MTEPTPADGKRPSTRRRPSFRLVAIVAVVVVVAVTAIAVSLSGGTTRSSGTPTAPVTGTHLDSAVELTGKVLVPVTANAGDEAEVSSSEQDFSLRLLRQLAGSSSSNVLVSPFSLDEALAMTLLGACGPTAGQIAGVLSVSGLSAQAQAAGWATLDADLLASSAKDHISLKDANSIWTQTGFPVEQSYLDSIENQFRAGVWQVDFDNHPGAAINAVNDWVGRATEGQIPTLLSQQDISAETAFVILNAVYFKAQWAAQMLDSSPGQFQSPAGSVGVTYLSGGDQQQLQASTGSGLDAVEVPYWNGNGTAGEQTPGRYSALLLMPTTGTLSQFIATLDSSTLERIVGALTSQTVDLQIPQVDISSTLDLNSALNAMGMTDAFGPSADLSGITKIATQISDVKQKATLHVTKYGTVASAATAVIAVASAAERSLPITFDRPFVFLVRDTKTGTILFESAIDNPGGS